MIVRFNFNGREISSQSGYTILKALSYVGIDIAHLCYYKLDKIKDFEEAGVEIICADSDEPGKVDLEAAMTGLAVKGIDSILLEGGAETAAAAFEAGIVDKIRFYLAPVIIGGIGAPGAIGGIGADRVSAAVPLENIRTERSGADLVVEAYVKKGKTYIKERKIGFDENENDSPADRRDPAGEQK